MTSVLQVVDSSGWIEVLTNGPQADRFLEVLDHEKSLIVRSVTIFEVFKWILREHSGAQAIATIYACHGRQHDPDDCEATSGSALQHGC